MIGLFLSNEQGAARGHMLQPNAASKTYEFDLSGFVTDGTPEQMAVFYKELGETIQKGIDKAKAIYHD
jgi:hypothetical protein